VQKIVDFYGFCKEPSVSLRTDCVAAGSPNRIVGPNPFSSAIIVSQMALSRDFAARKLEEFGAF
jgi:hypothetical protein